MLFHHTSHILVTELSYMSIILLYQWYSCLHNLLLIQVYFHDLTQKEFPSPPPSSPPPPDLRHKSNTWFSLMKPVLFRCDMEFLKEQVFDDGSENRLSTIPLSQAKVTQQQSSKLDLRRILGDYVYDLILSIKFACIIFPLVGPPDHRSIPTLIINPAHWSY